MGGGFEVRPGDLANHAAEVEAVAKSISFAGGKAHAVGIGTMQMYGLLCSPLMMPILSRLFDDTDDLIKKTGELGADCADGLRATKESYEEIDKALKELIGKIG